MAGSILGIDIAKQKLDVALVIDGKIKNKSVKNNPEGFEALSLWLRKLDSSAQRVNWFKRGFEQGNFQACNTFNAN